MNFEQKNKNILNRFETKEEKGGLNKFTIHFKDKTKCTMLAKESTVQEINAICKNTFCDSFDYAEI